MRSGAGAPPAGDAPIPRDLEAHKSLEARASSLEYCSYSIGGPENGRRARREDDEKKLENESKVGIAGIEAKRGLDSVSSSSRFQGRSRSRKGVLMSRACLEDRKVRRRADGRCTRGRGPGEVLRKTQDVDERSRVSTNSLE